MGSFLDFRNNINNRLKTRIATNVLRLESSSVNDVLSKASQYFNVPNTKLKFEIESFVERTLFSEPKYKILAYPISDYSYVDEETHTIKNLNGEFFIRRGRGNFLLMVTKPDEGGEQVKVDDVRDYLDNRHSIASRVDFSLIKLIIEEQAGEWKSIASFEHKAEHDAEVEVRMASDDMSAQILLRPPHEDGADPSKKKIMDAIRGIGVSFGVKGEVVDRLEKIPVYNQWIEVAAGIPAKNGEDSKIEIISDHRYQMKKRLSKHLIGGELVTVVKGDVIARKVMFTDGEDGKTLMGEILFAMEGNDIKMEGNENVQISADGNEVIALTDGSVYVRGNKVLVEKIWRINGDLTHEIGDIDFPGTVIIDGSIIDEHIVKVRGNLIVDGGIGNAHIEVGGNLEVYNGINGRDKGHIDVKGRVWAKFVERANLVVGGLCVVSDSIIASNIVCHDRLVVIEGRGRIISSKIISAKEILAKKIGSDLGASSDIRVVTYIDEREHLATLEGKSNKIKKELENLEGYLGEAMTPEKFKKLQDKHKEQVRETLREIKQKQVESRKIRSQIHIHRAKFKESSTDVKITILEEILEETELTLNDERRIIRDNLTSVQFYLKEKVIVNRSLNNVRKIMEMNTREKLLGKIKLG